MNVLEKIFKKSAWKSKAIIRSVELKMLRKRIRELEVSRDKWKAKAIERQFKVEAIEHQKLEIENELKKN